MGHLPRICGRRARMVANEKILPISFVSDSQTAANENGLSLTASETPLRKRFCKILSLIALLWTLLNSAGLRFFVIRIAAFGQSSVMPAPTYSALQRTQKEAQPTSVAMQQEPTLVVYRLSQNTGAVYHCRLR